MSDEIKNENDEALVDEDAAAPAEPAPAPRKRKPKAAFKAELVRGRLYVFKGQKFEAGKAVPISAEVKAHLEQHAVDMITVEGQAEPRQKFKFSKA